jgi:hypothetical protein
MANDHPFQNLFETLGRIPAAHAESVNRRAYEVLSDILTVPLEKAGRCILLRAPRAGHGKTHLLSRIQHQLGAMHEFIPLHAAYGYKIDAATVTEDALRRMVRQLPASGGLTVLDLVARRLFASALQPLVSSGEVPSEDREGALAALRNRPVETFDFHHPNAVTAHWAKQNFELLSQRLSYELAQRSGIPVREIDFWVGVLFRYSSAPLDNPNRLRLLTERVHSGEGLEMERLEALLGLLTLQVRVVLVADDLEGFSTDETAALRLAAFLGALRHSVERVDVILSLNQDIWQSAFTPRLSGGLADRLSEVVVELEPLKEAEMAALLDSRAPGLGNQLLGKIDIGKSGTHARGLIRAAGMAWLKATATDSSPAEPLAPFHSPLPAMAPPASPAVPKPAPEVPILAPIFEAALHKEPAVYRCPPPLPPAEQATAAVTNNPTFFTAQADVPTGTVPSDVKPAASATHSFLPPSEPEKNKSLEDDFSPLDEIPDSLDSPFKIVPEKTVRSPFEPPQDAWISQPKPSVFQAKPVEVTPPVFIPEPVAAAFFQAPKPIFQAVQEEPAAPRFNPEAAVAFFQALESGPQAGPSENTPSVPATASPPPAFQLPPDSPFEIVTPKQATAPASSSAIDPFSRPAAQPISPSTPVNPPSTGADTDRVDDLLRQFRERYGRGSL